MWTAHDILAGIQAHVVDKKSKVYIQTVKLDKDGNMRLYLKEVSGLKYDHKNRRVIFK